MVGCVHTKHAACLASVGAAAQVCSQDMDNSCLHESDSYGMLHTAGAALCMQKGWLPFVCYLLAAAQCYEHHCF